MTCLPAPSITCSQLIILLLSVHNTSTSSIVHCRHGDVAKGLQWPFPQAPGPCPPQTQSAEEPPSLISRKYPHCRVWHGARTCQPSSASSSLPAVSVLGLGALGGMQLLEEAEGRRDRLCGDTSNQSSPKVITMAVLNSTGWCLKARGAMWENNCERKGWRHRTACGLPSEAWPCGRDGPLLLGKGAEYP